MFAMLGDIKFEFIRYFESIQSTQGSNYAENRRIGRKPKLQFTDEALEVLPIRVKFHFSFCNPETEIKKLEDARKKHLVLPYIYGNGKYQGKYVITEISKNPVQLDNLGNILVLEADIKLVEYVKDDTTGKKKQQPKKGVIKKKIVKTQKTSTTNRVQPKKTQSLPALKPDEVKKITRS